MLWNKQTTVATGKHWEDVAKQHLLDHGLVFISQNFNGKQGELDIIMKDNDYYVFVEVKYRKSKQFGGAISAITASKQEKILKTAAFFLQQQGLNAYNTPCRFDIVAIDGELNPEISWLKNAF